MSDEQDAPKRRRRSAAPPPPPQGSVIKGAILVAAALLIGFVLLNDSGNAISTAAVGNDDPVSASTTAPEDATTTTAPPVARPAAEVKVLVANAAGVSGAASAQTDDLKTLGYVTANPTDANAKVTTSVIYFVAGYEVEANVLATALGLDPATALAVLPTPAPVGDTQESNLILVLGPDLATA